MFADSSKEVAAAVVYLRVCTGKQCHVALLESKISIYCEQEVKRQLIPRKEIIALDLGARLLRECLESTGLPIKDYVLWSDSKTVISWCSTKSLELPMFEQNRVDSILRNCNGKLPRYVSTKQNPADVATRGCHVDQDEKWEFWIKGPDFLWKPDLEWEDLQYNCSAIDPGTLPIPMITLSSTSTLPPNNKDFMGHTLDRTYKVAKPARILLLIINCARKWKMCLASHRSEMKEEVEPHTASVLLVRIAQRELFEKIIDQMQNGLTYEETVKRTPKHKRERWMTSLIGFVPFLDHNGILRIGGRLSNSTELMDEQMHPAALPRRNKVTKLFIIDRHTKLAHRGAETVPASLQNDVGLKPLGCIATVRHFLANCFTCKLLRKSRASQLVAPLPKYRITSRQPVFSSVSVDYAGPFEVKRHRSLEKRWICIFACNATSAVRIKVVESQETTAFLNSFRRFQGLNGNKTKHIRSDCATNFFGAQNMMREELKLAVGAFESSAELKQWLMNMEVTWEFSTPASSHHQGFIERKIRTFRNVTEGVLKSDNAKRTPTNFELLTILRETEYVMNCLPLGQHLGDEDSLQPLRPIDLTVGFCAPGNERASLYQFASRDEFRKGYVYTQKTADLWWNRWLSTYLPSLQRRQKWTTVEDNIKKGDAVLFIDQTNPLRAFAICRCYRH